MIINHPNFEGPVRFQVTDLGDVPDVQVEKTIARMRELAIADSMHPLVRAAAATALAAQPTNPLEAVFNAVKRRLQFQTDEETAAALPAMGAPVIEVLQRPVDILHSRGRGDCDDFSMLLASMLLALGIPASFVTVAADPAAPQQYSHVYVAVYAGRRIAMDASHGPYVGWETPNRYGKRREWPLIEQEWQ